MDISVLERFKSTIGETEIHNEAYTCSYSKFRNFNSTRWISYGMESRQPRLRIVMCSLTETPIVFESEKFLTTISMEMSSSAFRELWEREDDNYWNQY